MKSFPAYMIANLPLRDLAPVKPTSDSVSYDLTDYTPQFYNMHIYIVAFLKHTTGIRHAYHWDKHTPGIQKLILHMQGC